MTLDELISKLQDLRKYFVGESEIWIGASTQEGAVPLELCFADLMANQAVDGDELYHSSYDDITIFIGNKSELIEPKYKNIEELLEEQQRYIEEQKIREQEDILESDINIHEIEIKDWTKALTDSSQEETDYLLSSKANRDNLLASIEQIEKGNKSNDELTLYYSKSLNWFQEKMMKKLLIHKSKGKWNSSNFVFFKEKLKEEVLELDRELYNINSSPNNTEYLEDLILECADVANICMMIADLAKERIRKNEKR